MTDLERENKRLLEALEWIVSYVEDYHDEKAVDCKEVAQAVLNGKTVQEFLQ